MVAIELRHQQRAEQGRHHDLRGGRLSPPRPLYHPISAFPESFLLRADHVIE